MCNKKTTGSTYLFTSDSLLYLITGVITAELVCFTKLFYYWCQVFPKTLANYHIIINKPFSECFCFLTALQCGEMMASLTSHHDREERKTDWHWHLRTDHVVTKGLCWLSSSELHTDWRCTDCCTVTALHCTAQNITIHCIFFYHANISSTVPSRYMQSISSIPVQLYVKVFQSRVECGIHSW